MSGPAFIQMDVHPCVRSRQSGLLFFIVTGFEAHKEYDAFFHHPDKSCGGRVSPVHDNQERLGYAGCSWHTVNLFFCKPHFIKLTFTAVTLQNHPVHDIIQTSKPYGCLGLCPFPAGCPEFFQGFLCSRDIDP